MTRLLPASEASIEEAARVLRQGGLVAFPTETVYGLGAVATNDRAVARIFAAKNRPAFNPLIVHVADRAAATPLARWTEAGEALAAAFWPGPLTLVLTREPSAPISPLVTAGLATVALLPLAAPSANPSGKVSPTTAAHVVEGLGEAVDLVLDGGPCSVGLESTVVDVSGARPRLLRPGGVPRAAIEAVVGPLEMAGDAAPVQAPGQLASHYAPRCAVRLDALRAAPGEAFLGFGSVLDETAAHRANLSPAGDLDEAARNLFACLRDLDRPDVAAIAVAPIPDQGLGEAINDRLRRAAAARPRSFSGFARQRIEQPDR
ncbi:MAG: L-threonylcarbamoyladenylate synthase [Pseudomonadota bacterium]